MSASQDVLLSPRALFLEAEQHLLAGRPADADRACREALAIDPHHADSLNLLGRMALQAGDVAAAIDALTKAVSADPNIAAYRFNLGLAQASQGDIEGAVASYRATIGLAPHLPLPYIYLCTVLTGEEHRPEAIASLRKALELDPTHAGAHHNLGALLLQDGDAGAAASCFRAAIDLRPDLVEAYAGLGYALRSLGHADEAIAWLRKALAFEPHSDVLFTVYESLGVALFDKNMSDDACAVFRRCVRLDPTSSGAYMNLGNTLLRQMRLPEAAAAYRNAITLQPDLADAHFGLGMTLLGRGDWITGAQEYEWRFLRGREASQDTYAERTRWRGEPAPGKTLFIVVEGGFGDTLQFCRYAPLAAAAGMTVILGVQPELQRLLRSLPNIEAMIPVNSKLPHFDLYCPMVSLPFAFGATPENVACAEGYLHPDPDDVAAWRRRLKSRADDGIRIGLVWSGNPRPDVPDQSQMNSRRSFSAERLEPLFDIPGLDFFSLQKGGPRPPSHFRLTDWTSEMQDFADTAALIANLDLVISVDTSIAHLAGALGKPVWMLSRYDACWRWMVDRDDTPWYSSMRLYRQTHPGYWDDVLTRVADDLRRMARDARECRAGERWSGG